MDRSGHDAPIVETRTPSFLNPNQVKQTDIVGKTPQLSASHWLGAAILLTYFFGIAGLVTFAFVFQLNLTHPPTPTRSSDTCQQDLAKLCFCPGHCKPMKL